MTAEDDNKKLSNDKVLAELKKLRSESIVKDFLLALIPLLVAGMSIYFSQQNVNKQLEFSNAQLKQTSEIENAKLLEEFSQSILHGGKEAELAKIALESIDLTESQMEQLSGFFENEIGGTDRPLTSQVVDSVVDTNIDLEFRTLMDQLFSSERKTRIVAYPATKTYLLENNTSDLIDQMIVKVKLEPFNINGRSNVLSILANMPEPKLMESKDKIQIFLTDIETKGSVSPAYAVGPQTNGWIGEVRNRLGS